MYNQNKLLKGQVRNTEKKVINEFHLGYKDIVTNYARNLNEL